MKSWMQNWKKIIGRNLIVPILTIGLVGSFVTYDFVKAMPAKAAMASPTTTPLDDNNVGVGFFAALHDMCEGGFESLRANHRSEVTDQDGFIEEPWIEEREELHVPDQLERRLGDRGEIQALLSLSRQVRQDLQHQDRFSAPGLAADDRRGLCWKAAAQNGSPWPRTARGEPVVARPRGR